MSVINKFIHSIKKPSLEYIERRLREYLIEIFRTFKGMDNVKVNKVFELAYASTRGHSLK